IVSVAVREFPFSAALMFTLVFAATVLVVTVNVALLAPAAIVTEAGTVAAALLLESATIAPPARAGVSSRTVPVDEPPPATVVGERLSEDGTGRMTPSWKAPAPRPATARGAVGASPRPQAPRLRS